MEIIKIRRSIRKYQNKPVERDKIEQLLRAAMQAPSAANQRPWEFIVVQDKETLKRLSGISPYSKMTADAPLALVLLGNREKFKRPDMWQQDMGAAAQNILLEAVELELGSVWLGIAPVEARMKYIKEMFQLNDSLQPFCVIAIGYPREEENVFIDRYDPSAVHYESYGRRGRIGI